jgi:hypothetical protein
MGGREGGREGKREGEDEKMCLKENGNGNGSAQQQKARPNVSLSSWFASQALEF